MKVLVTGGLGNVGRSCLSELLQQKHQVKWLSISLRNYQSKLLNKFYLNIFYDIMVKGQKGVMR